MHAMSLNDDESNGIRGMLQANGVYTLLDILSISFKYIENIECKVNNKRQTLNVAATNRLIILKSFSIHKERMKTPIRMNEWISVDSD